MANAVQQDCDKSLSGILFYRLSSGFWPPILALLIIASHLQAGSGDKTRTWVPKEIPRGYTPELFVSEGKAVKPPIAYRFDIRFSGEEKVDGRDCFTFNFYPGDKFPPEAQHPMTILIDKENGWPRKATLTKERKPVKIEKVGDAAILIDAPAGVPCDILPLFVSSGEFREGDAVVKYDSKRVKDELFLELRYSVAGKEKLRVRQRWRDEDDWWRYYEKYVDGVLVLRARRWAATPPLEDIFGEPSPPKVVKVDPPKPKPEPVLLPGLIPLASEKDRHPLIVDKRLYALVHVEPNRPSIQHILFRIQEATKLTMELGPGLEKHAPDLGYINPAKNGWYAWSLMEIIQRKELENAQWERTVSGYRLNGTSMVPVSRKIETTGETRKPPSNETPPEPASNSKWYAIGGSVIAVTLLVSAAIFWQKRRHKKKPPSA
jgi:hypothetical protein